MGRWGEQLEGWRELKEAGLWHPPSTASDDMVGVDTVGVDMVGVVGRGGVSSRYDGAVNLVIQGAACTGVSLSQRDVRNQ